MAVPDFSKIWASLSGNRYVFSDNEYQTGWDFIGKTLVPRQMFDEIQYRADTKLKWLYDNYAPLESPTFTGAPKAPTPGKDDNSTRIATTAWGQSWVTSLSRAIETAQSTANNAAEISSASVGTSGYVKFKNGFIIQWGLMGTNGYTEPMVFPISYSNTKWSVVGSHITFNGTPTVIVFDANSKTVNGCIMGVWDLKNQTWIDNAAYIITVGN